MKIISTLIAGFILLSGCSSSTGSFTIVNGASENIKSLSVEIDGQQHRFYGLESQDDVSGSYTIKSDASFEISVEFSSGKRLTKKLGYVTNGFDYKHIFLVMETNIEANTIVIDNAN